MAENESEKDKSSSQLAERTDRLREGRQLPMIGPNLFRPCPKETPMPDPDSIELRRRALSRWDDEGGALASVSQGIPAEVPGMTNAELVQLRIRIIALENLLIAVLAEGSDRQLQLAREMADCISPRPGFTQHPLTVQAAKHMTNLADRAVHFQGSPPS